MPSDQYVVHQGITLRQYLAGMALAGEMASQSETGEYANSTPDKFLRERAQFMWRFADAMLATENETSVEGTP